MAALGGRAALSLLGVVAFPWGLALGQRQVACAIGSEVVYCGDLPNSDGEGCDYYDMMTWDCSRCSYCPGGWISDATSPAPPSPRPTPAPVRPEPNATRPGNRSCYDDPLGIVEADPSKDCGNVGVSEWWSCNHYDGDFNGHAVYIYQLCPLSCQRCDAMPNATRPEPRAPCVTIPNSKVDELEEMGLTPVYCEEARLRRRLKGLPEGPPCPSSKARNLFSRHFNKKGAREHRAPYWI